MNTIEEISPFTTMEDHITLEKRISKIRFYKLAWALKMYEMNYPHIFQIMYRDHTFDRCKGILGLPSQKTAFTRMGIISLFTKQCDINNAVFGKVYGDEWGWGDKFRPCEAAKEHFLASAKVVDNIKLSYYELPAEDAFNREKQIKLVAEIEVELNNLQVKGEERSCC